MITQGGGGLRYERSSARRLRLQISTSSADATLASECPLLRTLVDGVPVSLDDEMLWRRDGTSFHQARPRRST